MICAFQNPREDSDFFIAPRGAASLTVEVFDSHEIELEEAVFPNGEAFAGMVRTRAEIGIVRIVARREALSIAEDSFFYIDDLSFGRELKGGY